MEVTSEVSESEALYHGHTNVGTTRVKVCEDFPTNRGIIIFSPGPGYPNENTGTIWIGGAQVTADSGPKGGIPLIPGGWMQLPVNDPSKLFVISDEEDQDIAWMGV